MSYTSSWNLSRYFYTGLSDSDLQSDIANILPATEIFQQKFGPIFSSFTQAEEIAHFYEEYSRVMYEISTPSYYLFYLQSLDAHNLEVLKKIGEVDAILLAAHEKLLFVVQGWKTLGYERIIKWANDSVCALYKNDLISTAEEIRYILTEKEEQVILSKSRPLGTLSSLHNELTRTFEFRVNIGDEERVVTEDEVRAYRSHSDRSLRKMAYEQLQSVYGSRQNQITLGNIYTGIVKNWVADMKLRGYEDGVMSERNISNQIPRSVIDMLLEEVEAYYPLYTRYLSAKAKKLNLTLRTSLETGQIQDNYFCIWDIGAPLGKTKRDFSFDEAYDMHLNVVRQFDEEFYQHSLDMVESERVDVFPHAGKHGGAFASYRKGDASFVLLNFNGKIRDVSTIAHEMGHAFHGHLSQIQSAPVYDAPIVLAETASIFSEMLLSEHLKTLVTLEEYLGLLDERLSDVFATIFRQVQYTLFERKVHQQIASGAELTYRELNTLWREEQEKTTGELILSDVPAEMDAGWAMIPHLFRTPFYCYAYAFGNILTFALYSRVKDGRLSVEQYKDILRAGGSQRPDELLGGCGIDIRSPDFYQSGLREVEKMLEEFETINL